MKRTHHCGQLRAANANEKVGLCGWVHRRRDHGGLIFIDLRDRSGLIQIVFNEENKELHALAQQLRSEYVIAVKGVVVKRSEATIKRDLPTGEIEVTGEELEILNTAKTPTIEIADPRTEPDEMVRLKYRYLDLRKEKMRENLIFRHKITKAMSDFLDDEGFLSIETPFLRQINARRGRGIIWFPAGSVPASSTRCRNHPSFTSRS